MEKQNNTYEQQAQDLLSEAWDISEIDWARRDGDIAGQIMEELLEVRDDHSDKLTEETINAIEELESFY